MCYIPDPIELLEMAEERQMDLLNKDGHYPCVDCGRYFDPMTMEAISVNPAAPLMCTRSDCDEETEKRKVKRMKLKE